jgi:diaminopimelate decarboxylase
MLKATDPYLSSGSVVCEVAHDALGRGHELEYVDLGGGFGIDYGDGAAEPPAAFAKAALRLLGQKGLSHLMLVVEPGRSIVGPFGVLVASVIQSKTSSVDDGQRRWVMIDAGMNDLLRPALYQARHRIEPLEHEPGEDSYRVVGPVCESTDDFGDFPLGQIPEQVVIRDSGAYSFTMASEYNGRPLPAEVFVKAGRVIHVAQSPGVDAWIAARTRA